jgi:NAD(P)-dependent dehydrogenase (short-subunit alcohol dehydrogenase family)
MDLHLSGKVAVVTGASKSIGLAVAEALAGEGTKVVVAARKLTGELSQLAAEHPVRPVLVDLGTPEGPAQVIDYCAAKAALANFCKALSKEVGPRGVRVNTVSPGPVSTGMWLGADGVAETVAQVSGGKPDEVAKQAAGGMVTGCFTAPREVADLVLLLASDRAGNVTRADFVIDGGLVTTL